MPHFKESHLEITELGLEAIKRLRVKEPKLTLTSRLKLLILLENSVNKPIPLSSFEKYNFENPTLGKCVSDLLFNSLIKIHV